MTLHAAPITITHPPGYRLRRFRNWLLLGLLYAGYYMCRYNLSTVTPEIAKELRFNNEQTGWFSTVRDLGYAVGQFVNGLFADALGGKQAMAIGALCTIGFNLLFAWFSNWTTLDAAVLFGGMLAIRLLDGYGQAFGSPGMVKTNTAWFRREERGKFAGLFGLVIQLGQACANSLSSILLKGGPIILVGITWFTVPKLDWRSMFFIPPAITAVLLLLAWLGVRNTPEEAGFRVERDRSGSDAESGTADLTRSLPLAQVFRAVAGNPMTWINAGAYFCTGFVRRASDFWWAKYLDNAWGLDKNSREFAWVGILLPLSAVAGSFTAGWLSDAVFRSRRSPVAALLYTLETIVILLALIMLSNPAIASPLLACWFLILISFTCNSSHSIIGTAAVMDIGGPRMAGFALGVVNSFQYVGAILAGAGLGKLIDHFGWNAAFATMLPFSALGMLLMVGLWWRTRGRVVQGA